MRSHVSVFALSALFLASCGQVAEVAPQWQAQPPVYGTSVATTNTTPVAPAPISQTAVIASRAPNPVPVIAAEPAPVSIPEPLPQSLPVETALLDIPQQSSIERVRAFGDGRPVAVSIPVANVPKVYVPFPRAKPRSRTSEPRVRYNDLRAGEGFEVHKGPTPASIEYNIPHRPQEGPLWCWAAAAQQAIGWVNNGRAPAQCAIVAMAHGISVEDCCGDPNGICSRTGEIPAIGALVRRFGGFAAEIEVPRSPEAIYSYLNRGSTLLIRLRPEPHQEAVGIRHMIVVRGIEWLKLPNGALQATLLYNDPLGADQRAVSFGAIVDFFEQAMVVRRET